MRLCSSNERYDFVHYQASSHKYKYFNMKLFSSPLGRTWRSFQCRLWWISKAICAQRNNTPALGCPSQKLLHHYTHLALFNSEAEVRSPRRLPKGAWLSAKTFPLALFGNRLFHPQQMTRLGKASFCKAYV